MYNEYFGLKELPFSIAPDPRYLYMSDQHREALAHLMYGINSDGGFVLLTGEVGTGKTTVCRCLLDKIPENTDVAFILNPKVTVEELLATVCDELRISYPEGNTSIKVFIDRINAYLLDAHSRGRKTVLIIEEAQNLCIDVLEQIRLLTNLETNERKLLQIIMLGQPELKDMLSRQELRQLSQRITARYHLGSLSKKEVYQYVKHRLAIAGLHSQLFPASLCSKLFDLSDGIPRKINLICDRALLGTYVQGKEHVDRKTLNRAAREVLGDTDVQEIQQKKAPVWAVVGLLFIICGVALAATYYNEEIRNAVSVPEELPQKEIMFNPIKPEGNSIGHDEENTELAAAPPVMDTLILPSALMHDDTERMSFQALLQKWGVEYIPQENSDACQDVQEFSLFCLQEKGSLRDLKHLNRPVIMKLFDDSDKEYYAALMTLSEETAVFVLGEKEITVPVSEIALRWKGEFMLLWKAPIKYQAYILPGSSGPRVKWLDRQIAFIKGTEAPLQVNPVYDEELISEVKNFQLHAGLVPDGIVGPRTVIHLNTASGADIPVLQELRGEK
jgi:general secretion pathway protein A